MIYLLIKYEFMQILHFFCVATDTSLMHFAFPPLAVKIYLLAKLIG